jgi:IS30 family transposase
VYSPLGGEESAVRRRAGKRPRARKIHSDLQTYIEERIREDWSPEQISGRLNRFGNRKSKISYVSIYRHIYREALLSNSDLYLHLRRRHKRRKRHEKRSYNVLFLHQLKNVNACSIENRPRIVEKRHRIGDYERDLIRGRETRGFVLTIVDRASRLIRLASLKEKTAQATHEATVQSLHGLGPVHTLTNDNGSEFFEHVKTAQDLNTKIYFAHPYSSWERGTIENSNGLIRQYLPKEMNFNTIDRETLTAIENRMNHRPRKCLGYKTPFEVYSAALSKDASVALAV